MQTRFTLTHFTALILSVLMVFTCMPVAVMAEDADIPQEDVTVEVISFETDEAPEAASGAEAADDTDQLGDAEAATEEETLSEVPDPESGNSETVPTDEMVEEESSESEETQPEETPAPDEPSLQDAIRVYGHVYVATVRKTSAFSSPELAADTLVYTTTNDIFLFLATDYTEHETVLVWFLDEDGNVVNGYVTARDLDDQYLLDEDIPSINFLPLGEGQTSVGLVGLFVANGTYPITEPGQDAAEEAPAPNESTSSDILDGMESSEDTETNDTAQEYPDNETEQFPSEDTPDETEEPTAEPEEPSGEGEEPPAGTEEPPVETEVPPVETEVPEEDSPESTAPSHDAAGSYVGVTTQTRVFASVNPEATETKYSSGYLGNFVKDATVQILSVDFDTNGTIWYQVRILYGDDFADGRMKWTDYSTAWILADETNETAGDSCTVTDFAYTKEFFQMTRRNGMMTLMATTPMDGFTLKNISGAIGGFYAWQSGLYGSSGRDSSYPALAKSAAYGTIYATPHYLEGFVVFCLEHNLSGPGEGDGHDQKPSGPYVLVDMDTFVTNPDYGGATGVRYKDSTMHALGWVLRHTYPFMALDRSDSDNEVWSRAAGQFAMREVIKRLEGAQYVRDYWDMDNFYAFSGGAPAVYLTYARWLAENGIARARITGNITASNQSLSVSGSNYVGTVKLTTDADLIRIPKSVGTLTGNSGGSDSSYYYVKSGDTIQVTSTSSKFAVTMESISSDTEEANFLVGVPTVAIQKILVPTYGAPNALKTGSVTFELSYGEILVTKKSSDGTLLRGAVFELLNSAGSVVATATTSAKGTVTFANLAPGTYTVREKTAPQGYSLSTSSSQNVSVVAGVTSNVTFTNNRIMGKIRIIKTDSVTGKKLAGAVFTVTRLSGPESDNASNIGKVVATITTNAQGIAETGDLPWGEYRITETGVPDGYIDSGFTTTVWIK